MKKFIVKENLHFSNKISKKKIDTNNFNKLISDKMKMKYF